jgi:tetratricopeptide (TPR) repeat protein
MPEKSLQDIPRTWREQYEKGRLAFEKNNLDYAISILSKVLEQEPGFYECREVLRLSQFKKAGTSSSGGFFKRMIGHANPKLVQAQVTLRNNPLEAIAVAEQVLSGDPNNLSAHRLLADAALATDLPKTAILSLEFVFKHAPKDRDVAFKLAQTLSRTGEAARAERILAELARNNPDNSEIIQAVKDAAANRTMDEGGYAGLADGQGSYRDILRDEKKSVSLEQEQREHKTEDVNTRLIDEYEERLKTEPQNLRLVRSIAELLVANKEFDRALDYYGRLAGTQAADPSLERAIGETRVKKLEHQLSLVDPNAPDAADQIARLEAEKKEFLLNDARSRVERYPNDLGLRFELGQLYFEAGRIGEAIAEFQKAQNNPHKRIGALAYLGRCFSRRGMNDLAVRTFQNALKEKLSFDDEKKDLMYDLGSALEKMGKREEAIEHFKQIYEADISYRDVAAKVDAYYSAQGG